MCVAFEIVNLSKGDVFLNMLKIKQDVSHIL